MSQKRESPRFMWTGVLNNPTEEEVEQLKSLYPQIAKELVIDKEVGKEGTPHLHIFLTLHDKKRLAQMKALSTRAHWEHVVSREACIQYCSKGDLILDHRAQVRSNQLDLAIQHVQTSGMHGIDQEYPRELVLHARGLRELAYMQLDQQQKCPPQVSWFYGNTGTGKTRAAYGSADPDSIFIVSGPNTKHGPMWFDGYMGQKVAIFDDFRPWWCSFSWLLRLLDRYPLRVPVKGGFVNWIPEQIIITAPQRWSDMFTGEYRTPEDIAQLGRRIHRCVHFVSFNAPTATFSLSSDAAVAYSPEGNLVSIGGNQSTSERFPLPSGIPLLPEPSVQLSQ